MLRGGNLNRGGTGREAWPKKGAESGGLGFAIVPLRREGRRDISALMRGGKDSGGGAGGNMCWPEM